MTKGTISHDNVRELRLYAYNTYELYPQFQAIIANLQRKIASGTYDATLAPKLWRYWVDNAAKSYSREFGPCKFPACDRQALAEQIAEEEYQGIMNGEYTQR